MNKFEIYTDKELIVLLQDAIEMRNGKWIKAIRNEINRRWRDA